MANSKYEQLVESWAIVNGLPIYFRQSARAHSPGTPTLIHLHGFAISGTYLLPTANELARDFRTFVPDLPGFGRSIHPDKVLGMKELGAVLIDFMDAMGIERASLVGNSMGCITAVEAARQAPDRFERLILVSPAGGPHNRPIFRGVAQLALDGLREPPSMFLIAPVDYLHYGLINAGRLFWSMIHYPTVENLQHVEKPTLVVLGRRDPLVSEQRFLDRFVDGLPVSIVRVEDAAHAINYSHPQLLSQLVRQFVTGGGVASDTAPAGATVLIE